MEEDVATLERLYRSIRRIRRVEEEVARVYPTDRIKSPVHLSIGQEAVCVAVCDALAPEDVVFGTYRGHALYLAKGGDLRADDRRAVRQGHRLRARQGRLDAPDRRRRTASWAPPRSSARTIPNAVGYAYAVKLQRRAGAWSRASSATGRSRRASFHESLNFAALKKLPILFVCENNGYAIHTSQRERQGGERRSATAPGATGSRPSASSDDVLRARTSGPGGGGGDPRAALGAGSSSA